MSEATPASGLPLAGYRALDLSDAWGYLCGRILADLGAEVVKIEPPGGDPGRRLGPFYGDTADPERSLYWFAYNTDKRSLVLDLDEPAGREALLELVDTADFLIESFPPGYLASRGLADETLRARRPSLIHTTITPFGATGPYAGRPASDLIVQATSGFLFVSGKADTPPVRVSVPQSPAMAGAQAAAGTLIAHHFRRRTGRGQWVDVSAQEALTTALMKTPISWDANQTIERRGGGPRRTIWRCADGWVAWTWYTGRGWGRKNLPLIEWMAELGLAEDLLDVDWEGRSLYDVPPEEKARWEGLWAAFLARFDRRTLYAEAVRRRIMLYPVNAPAEMLEDAQAVARGFFRPIAHDELGRAFTYPGPFVRSTAYTLGPRRRAPRVGEWATGRREDEERMTDDGRPTTGGARPHPGPAQWAGSAVSPPHPVALAGLKVLDLSWAVAGPLTTRTLAVYGADVIKVEWRQRPDAWRVTAPFIGNKPGINNSVGFADHNVSKRSIAVDLRRPEGRAIALALARWADVVVENFSPGVLERMGLGYEALRAARPDTILVSLSMQGQQGPNARHPGVGSLLQALVGIDYLSGWPDDQPAGPNELYPDYISPWFTVAAILAALEHRDRTGEGQYMDLAQTDTALHFLSPAILDATFNGRVMTRQGNRDPDAAPHGVYATDGGRWTADGRAAGGSPLALRASQGGSVPPDPGRAHRPSSTVPPDAGPGRPEEERWLALAVFNEAQWRALCAVAGDAEWARDPRFADFAARKANEDALEAALADWVRGWQAEELAERLVRAGVPAAVVANGRDLHTDPQLAHRGHYVALAHPVLGERRFQLPAFRLSETPPRLERAPLLGEHTAEVLRETLGYSDDQIADLLAAGVIATE